MNKYWPYFTALAALVFVGLLVLGYQTSRQNPVSPAKNQVTPATNQTQNVGTSIIPTQKIVNPTLVQSGNIPLTITNPVNGSIVRNARIAVSGKTSPNANVFVNNLDLMANNKGDFSTNIILDEGENMIVVADRKSVV